MGPPSDTRLVFPSTLDETAKALQTVLADVAANGFRKDAVFAIHLALDEALSNAVRHGNRGDPTKKVTVDYTITDQAFEVTVSDEGGGFRPDSVPDPTEDANLERPSGRGLMLIKAYMTHVEFNKAGNHVRLVKRRDCVLPLGRKP